MDMTFRVAALAITASLGVGSCAQANDKAPLAASNEGNSGESLNMAAANCPPWLPPEFSDPIRDLDRAMARNDRRALALETDAAGAVWIPTTPAHLDVNELMDRFGWRIVKRMRDDMTGDPCDMLDDTGAEAGHRYLQRYNSELIRRLVAQHAIRQPVVDDPFQD